MPSVYPDFYPEFHCLASRCTHSCCKGWQIDVDNSSADYYLTLPGTLGDALRLNLKKDDEGWHFRLDQEERCPFLQKSGLCRIICELGEESLCDICALHPRFYGSLGEWEFCGLGLSCEAVVMLLTQSEAPLKYRIENEMLDISNLLRRIGIPLSTDFLHFIPYPDYEHYQKILNALSLTEPIDNAWTIEVEYLRTNLDTVVCRLNEMPRPHSFPLYDKIFSYILYRQLERLNLYPIDVLQAFARSSTEFVLLQSIMDGDVSEHLRRWSEQIEYSTENVDRLLTSPEYSSSSIM